MDFCKYVSSGARELDAKLTRFVLAAILFPVLLNTHSSPVPAVKPEGHWGVYPQKLWPSHCVSQRELPCCLGIADDGTFHVKSPSFIPGEYEVTLP